MVKTLYKSITACRSCGGVQMDGVLDLGEPFISDFILSCEPEDRAPLELVVCKDCSLVQLRHTVDRDRLYRDNYRYQSGINESMITALKDVVDDACSRVKLNSEDKVLDIGANDGTLLGFYPNYVNCYGYEPAWNLWEKAKKKSRGCIYPAYFPRAMCIRDKYKIITSIAQLYNVDDLNGYVSAVKRCLAVDGVWIVQMQDLEGMLACNGVDNICHEHLTYIGRQAIELLLARHGMRIIDSSRNTTNGDSVRFVITHGSGLLHPTTRTTKDELSRFTNSVELNRTRLIELLRDIRDSGKTVFGVAASTKANTLLQYYGIGTDLLPAIADRSPEKVGRITVGMHIPIISERELYERKPDYCLALAWHFIDSFRQRYADLDTQWIVPLPEVRPLEALSCQSTTGVTFARH